MLGNKYFQGYFYLNGNCMLKKTNSAYSSEC